MQEQDHKGFKNIIGSRVGHVIATRLFTFLRFTGPIGGFLYNINLLASLWIAAFQTKKMTMPGRGGGGHAWNYRAFSGRQSN